MIEIVSERVVGLSVFSINGSSMLAYVLSVPSRLGSWVQRHKGKIIGSAALAGAAWYWYGDTIKQAWTMYKLIQEMQAGQVEEGSSSESQASDESFIQTVSTGDEMSVKNFVSIRTARAELYGDALEKAQQGLRDTKTSPDEKSAMFEKLNGLCYCRLALSIISVYLVLLLGRIEVCLIGRANRRANRQISDDEKAEHRELLGALRLASSKDLLARIDETVRKNIPALSPTRLVSPNSLVEELEEVIDAILSDLKRIGPDANQSDFGWLLGRLAQESPDDQSTITKETLDVLESPQFATVLSYLVKSGLRESIARSTPDSVNSKTNAIPLAVLIPGLKAEAESVTATDSAHVLLLQKAGIVDEFCRAVYSAEDSRDELTFEGIESSSSDEDANMAKLGELLEKLVKADMTKT